MRIYRQLLVPAALITIAAAGSCTIQNSDVKNSSEAAKGALKPAFVTDPVKYDTDDPAIWINTKNPAQSLVIGTDKDNDGGLFVFNLEGRIVNKVGGLQRPNNVDIAYGLDINGTPTDVAITTEREQNRIRIFSLPDMKAIDNGGISVFEGEQERQPMGIAIYIRPSDRAIYAIVGRKSGPADEYLWQYLLADDGHGQVEATLVRKFGHYSQKKEIESIAVDNELGYVYYSDEQYGVHKYFANPDSGNTELALFGQGDFKEDIEGISIYKHPNGTGYILISNQQDNSFVIYPREGANGNPHSHRPIASIPFSTIESDGSEVTSTALNARFPQGLFVAMSNGKTFQFYDWQDIQKRIDAMPK